jgi:hypothetical protein
LLVLLHRIECKAEAPGKLRLGQPNLARRARTSFGEGGGFTCSAAANSASVHASRSPPRLRLYFLFTGLRPRGQLCQEFRVVDLSPGASHDRHPVPFGSHSASWWFCTYLNERGCMCQILMGVALGHSSAYTLSPTIGILRCRWSGDQTFSPLDGSMTCTLEVC